MSQTYQLEIIKYLAKSKKKRSKNLTILYIEQCNYRHVQMTVLYTHCN